MPNSLPRSPGKVFLVGAGPGDPGLLTLRGAAALGKADVVLYDYLVNPRVLEHARPTAECVCLGRHGRDGVVPQAEINGRLVREAQAGKTVVRLKGGDPAIFARLAEETAALAEAGIPFEIVPGITTALAAGSYAGIPLTVRGVASAIALVTGKEDDEKRAPDLDYGKLAAFPGTLVFYMGVTSAPHWTQSLIAAGKPADTPAAIIRRCTWPDQATWCCTLAEVPRLLDSQRMRPPAIVVVGDVVPMQPLATWFQLRPLFGLGVLIARPAGQEAALRDRFEELGAMAYSQPAIAIGPPSDWAPLDAAIARLEAFEWVVFSSANGVRAMLDRLAALGADVRRFGRSRLACVGPGTAEELARYRLKADLVPREFRAEALAEALGPQADGSRMLLIRASRGREVLAEELVAAGALVEQVVAYSSSDVPAADQAIVEAMANGRLHWAAVTSSAIASSLVRLFGDRLRAVKLASISPVASATLRDLGFEPAAEATTYTMEGVVQAVLHAESQLRETR